MCPERAYLAGSNRMAEVECPARTSSDMPEVPAQAAPRWRLRWNIAVSASATTTSGSAAAWI